MSSFLRFLYRTFFLGTIIFVCLKLLEFNLAHNGKTVLLGHRNRTDLDAIVSIFSSQNISVYLFDEELVMGQKISAFPYYHVLKKRAILLGIDTRTFTVRKEGEVQKLLKVQNFTIVPIYAFKSYNKKVHRTYIAYILERYNIYQCLFMYSREDSTWWYGHLLNNKIILTKKGITGMQANDKMLAYEGLINKFEATSKRISNLEETILVPKYFQKFIIELSESFYTECNHTRARLFKNKYPPDNNIRNQRFKHRAWKLLALVKTILDGLSIKFWLSSGTCLGYFRECDFIPYSNDVDIGIFAADYNDNIIPEMKAHGLIWKHWFGLKNDSLELSFVDKNGLKLDIFFFYEEANIFWNGGTQAKTGLKFKYIFPKFELCWTLFQNLKVRVPCNTEQYIVANYGPSWFVQVQHWDWKTSPFNVIQNGKWNKEELLYAVIINP